MPVVVDPQDTLTQLDAVLGDWKSDTEWAATVQEVGAVYRVVEPRDTALTTAGGLWSSKRTGKASK
ncbi:hypothetical protein [Neptunomonas phycophila]